MITEALTILFVERLAPSVAFYTNVLGIEPHVHVPVYVEFKLNNGASLGLMLASRIKELLGDAMPDPRTANGIPRAEVYLVVDDAAVYHDRALKNGAVEISALQRRDWGHVAAYSLDPDRHVIAFAHAIAIE